MLRPCAQSTQSASVCRMTEEQGNILCWAPRQTHNVVLALKEAGYPFGCPNIYIADTTHYTVVTENRQVSCSMRKVNVVNPCQRAAVTVTTNLKAKQSIPINGLCDESTECLHIGHETTIENEPITKYKV